jgi:hypothetical protein
MNTLSISVFSALLVVGIAPANAQHYRSPNEGQTLQPSRQYQQMQAEQQRRASTYYYQQAPAYTQPAATGQSRTTPYPDSSLRSLGFAPVVTQLSPRAIDAVSNCASQAANGAVWGKLAGGNRGALVEAARGCLTK